MPTRPIKLVGVACGEGAGRPGAEEGPAFLREFGLIERLVDAGLSVEDLGDIPGIHEARISARSAQIFHLAAVLQVNRHIHACVLGTRRKSPDSFLLVIGGDHSLAIGTLAGLSDSCGRLGLLWVDAHADFNTPWSSPSGNAHGMSLAIACGRGDIELRSLADRDPLVLEEDVYLLGPRDVDPGERDELAASRVVHLSTRALRERGPTQTLVAAAQQLAARCDHVHLSFDIDSLDAALVPGTGTPVDDGLTLAEASDALGALGELDAVGSAEFVEYNPSLDRDGRTAEAMLALIEALLAPRAR